MKKIQTGNEEKVVYAIIINYKAYEDTIECIEHLLQSSYKTLKIVVVDNKSPNNSIEKIQEWLNFQVISALNSPYSLYQGNDDISFHNKITLIQATSNDGFACGNNLVLRRLIDTDSFIFLVNPDIIVTPSTITNLVKCITVTHNKCIVGCSIHDYDTKNVKFYGVRLNHLTGTIKEITNANDKNFDYVCGGATFLAASTLKDIGVLPEDYFLYWEDAEWGYKAINNGYDLIVCNEAFVYDKGATSIGRGYLAEYYYTRNSLIFHKKIGKQTFSIIASNLLFRLPKKIVLGQINRAKAVIAGTIDFISNRYKDEPKKEITIN